MQFFLEATAVSLMGGVIGIALGIAGAKILETVIKMQTLISWEVRPISVFSIKERCFLSRYSATKVLGTPITN